MIYFHDAAKANTDKVKVIFLTRTLDVAESSCALGCRRD